MKLTVLGKSPAWTDAGGACSGYLVEGEGGRPFLLDCGNGVFGKLRLRRDYRDVEAVVISHLHADHLLDLVPFAYALTVGPDAGAVRRPRLIAPTGADSFFRHLVGTWDSEDLIGRAFAIEEYEAGAELEVGGIAVSAHAVPHFGPTHAIALAGEGGRIVFGSDGRSSEQLAAAARGADVLIAEATLAAPDPAPEQERGHMSAGEAGALAERAGAGRLVLTHISDELDADRAIADARSSFAGPVEVAAEGSAWVV
ncbi:MAG: MBL fold metallo-hydrolase [Solirubrobacterales bacterium]|nr:MBL fold metallo-hydrolase [Solirubrobacterales bacterium]